MYQLYIANKNYSSWSLRAWLLMRKLDIAFEEKQVVFQSPSNWCAFRQFSPGGTVPCLLDGDVTIWDSMAITEYLYEQHPLVWPCEVRARTWARCMAAEMHSGFLTLRENCPMNCALTVSLKALSDPLRRDIARIDELWCDALEGFGGPYLAGDNFSAADAFFAPVVFRIKSFQLHLSEPASCYQAMMLREPAMLCWYTAALQEPWRDPAEEAKIQRVAQRVEDCRRS